MLISYKNKIYTTLGTPTELSGNVVSTTDSAGVPAKDYTVKGKTIVWNQLFVNSATSSNGVTISQNQDGTITLNGTANKTYINFTNLSDAMNQVHKYLLCLKILNNPDNVSFYYSWLNRNGMRTGIISNGESCTICNQTEALTQGGKSTGLTGFAAGTVFNNVKVAVMVMDLTQMFGVGNEPATSEEFRAMFPDDYYSYNAGELKTIVPTSIEASGIERFQLLDKSKFAFTGTYTKNGVDFINNGDGTYTVTGTASQTTTAFIQNFTAPIPAGHVYYMYGIPESVVSANDIIFAAYNVSAGVFFAYNNIITASSTFNNVRILVNAGRTVNNLLVKPQLFDLTQMFGVGNEPATPAEFWQRVPEKLYGYNPNDYKSANIPSSKYFPDGMKSIDSVYDEINFLSQKAIKRVGVRAYQTGDENDANVMTDKTNTVYELATPVETEITPPLQALPTYKGFTSFSAPNSLMQNGPLSVTYYAEGGANPESGWLTSYKRKLYMGRNIEWNQLFTNSRTSSNGVTISQNQGGTITLNGTANKSYINFTNLSDAMNQLHKYLLCLKVLNNPSEISISYKWLNRYLMRTSTISSGESCAICNQTADYIQLDRGNGIDGFATGTVFNNVKIAVMAIDLTQMFGAGNEPATPAEFWTYFDHKLYPYNPGETQPLFKISRKSQLGTASLYDYTFDESTGVLTLNKAPHSQSGDTLTIL